MQALLLHSPSASEDGPSKDQLFDLFRQEGFTPCYCSVKDSGIVEALSQPHDLIVAIGGDGTVTTVLTHMPNRSVPGTGVLLRYSDISALWCELLRFLLAIRPA